MNCLAGFFDTFEISDMPVATVERYLYYKQLGIVDAGTCDNVPAKHLTSRGSTARVSHI